MIPQLGYRKHSAKEIAYLEAQEARHRENDRRFLALRGRIEGEIPHLIMPGAFSPSLCAKLVELHGTGSRNSGFMFPNEVGEVVERIEPSLKLREDHYVTDEDTLAEIGEAFQQVRRFLLPAYHPTFEIERHLVARYPVGGHFSPHIDNLLPGTLHRELAVTINLTDAYQGGGLLFPAHDNGVLAAGVGDAIIFPCTALHGVLPVTSGQRFAYLTFLYGTDFK